MISRAFASPRLATPFFFRARNKTPTGKPWVSTLAARTGSLSADSKLDYELENEILAHIEEASIAYPAAGT
jgi:hypothetical protein